jgi:hypothetical protein
VYILIYYLCPPAIKILGWFLDTWCRMTSIKTSALRKHPCQMRIPGVTILTDYWYLIWIFIEIDCESPRHLGSGLTCQAYRVYASTNQLKVNNTSKIAVLDFCRRFFVKLLSKNVINDNFLARCIFDWLLFMPSKGHGARNNGYIKLHFVPFN